jgi:hypothetical protein
VTDPASDSTPAPGPADAEPVSPEDVKASPVGDHDGADQGDGDDDASARGADSDREQSQRSKDNRAFDDMLRPSGRHSAVVDSVRARASFVGNTYVQSVTISSEGNRYSVPLSDLSALHARAVFTPPPGYQDLVAAVTERRIVVCCGPTGCGKELTVTRALELAGRKVIRLLPASLSVAEMSRVIAAEHENGGAFVLPALNDAWLRSLAGPSGQSVRALAVSGQITVVAIAATEPKGTLARLFKVVPVSYPDATAVLAGYADDAPQGVRELAVATLAELDPPIGPVDVEAVLAEAKARPDSSPADIASRFTNSVSIEAISEWIADGRDPGDVAMLAAGATLSGEPDIVVQEQADRLRALLEPAEQREKAQRLVTPGTSWPAGLLEPATEMVNMHYGVQRYRAVQVAAPHRPQDVVRAMWETLGPSFRSQYCDWLTSLPAVRRLRWHAAYSAGVLLTTDPVLIEERVLRQWLNSPRAADRRCAGLALGAPVAIGSDPTTARRLANAWATSNSVRLRQAAIAAYGGLLGAWDAASAAPLKLFIIGQRTPELQTESDYALAHLVVAGAEATGARTSVISYLKLTLADRTNRTRMFGCLPIIAETLVRPQTVCVESFAALRAEPDNWRNFLGLIATAMTEPMGMTYGQECLSRLVQASARDLIDHEVVEDAIRSMKESQRQTGNLQRLRSAVRRTLGPLSRTDHEQTATTANALMRRFLG